MYFIFSNYFWRRILNLTQLRFPHACRRRIQFYPHSVPDTGGPLHICNCRFQMQSSVSSISHTRLYPTLTSSPQINYKSCLTRLNFLKHTKIIEEYKYLNIFLTVMHFDIHVPVAELCLTQDYVPLTLD